MHDLTIFTIATDKYLQYWLDLVKSSNTYLSKDISVQWIVFTNRGDELQNDTALVSKIDLIIKPINSLDWPLPTLLRYSLLQSVSGVITGTNIMYIDADMLFVSPVGKKDLMFLNSNSKIKLIMHPGFYRDTGLNLMIFYLKNLKFVLKDLKLKIRYGAIGTWETNKKSCAYVKRLKRKKYVCGGIWFGEKQSILEMCHELAERISVDYSQNLIAKFHDESHLNWFASRSSFILLNPELCFDKTYPQLSKLRPKIIAVEKNL
jgi:hypothetical protein